MANKKAIIFDFDGTLIDSFKLVNKSISQTVNHFGYTEINDQNVIEHFGPTEPGIIKSIVGDDIYPEAYDYFIKLYQEMQPTYLHEDKKVTELLTRLQKESDLLLLLITGRSEETLNISLDYLNYRKYFSKYYFGSMDGINKNLSIQQALKDYSLEKKDIIYIGDSIADINTMKSCAVDLISVGYFHDSNYAMKTKELNPNNFAQSIGELETQLEKYIK